MDDGDTPAHDAGDIGERFDQVRNPKDRRAMALLSLGVACAAPGSAPLSPASGKDAVDRVDDVATFDQIAKTEGGGRFYELPRVMFAIDRSTKTPKVHWINTQRFPYHWEFLRGRYLTLADAATFNDANYSRPDRRFVLGAVVRYPRLNRYGVELWEGDKVEPALLSAMMAQLQATFFAPLTFKPNSDQQRDAAATAGLATIGIAEAYGSRDQLVLNRGTAVGRLVLVPEGGEDSLLPGDIALLKTTPIRMPPVAGIVSATFTTPINHISLLAKTWGIPNVYRADADQLYAALDGKQVVLEAEGASVTRARRDRCRGPQGRPSAIAARRSARRRPIWPMPACPRSPSRPRNGSIAPGPRRPIWARSRR